MYIWLVCASLDCSMSVQHISMLKSHYVEVITLIGASMVIAQKVLSLFFINTCHRLSIYSLGVQICFVCFFSLWNLNVDRISMQDSFSLTGSSTEVCVWPETKRSTQFKHFSECFLGNTILFEYYVNHCDLEWIFFKRSMLICGCYNVFSLYW